MSLVNFDYRIISLMMQFVEKLGVPMAEVWLWALGQLFSGHLKLQTSDSKQEAWPIPLKVNAGSRGVPQIQVGSRLYPVGVVVDRLAHLDACLLDPTENGNTCRRLFPFFLGQDWEFAYPKIGDFSLISPIELDFFISIKELSPIVSSLDKIGFRPLEEEEVQLKDLIHLGFKYGSHLLLVGDEIRLLEVDWNEKTSFSDTVLKEVFLMNLDQPLAVISTGKLLSQLP